MQVITHPTSAYSSDYIWDNATVGFTDRFKPKKPRGGMASRRTVSWHKGLSSDPDAIERFNNRSQKELWDWQGRCSKCKCVRDKELLEPNGGLCESCHSRQENEHGHERQDSERSGQAA